VVQNTDPTENVQKSNAGWNIHAVIDRLDSIALFMLATVIAVVASFLYYIYELPENKFLTFASFIAIVGVILFCYKWVQKQVLNTMTNSVIQEIRLGFEAQNKILDGFGTRLDGFGTEFTGFKKEVNGMLDKFEEKLDKFEEKLDKFGEGLNALSADVAYLKGRYDQEKQQ
jgi:type III secretory pathway component EscS